MTAGHIRVQKGNALRGTSVKFAEGDFELLRKAACRSDVSVSEYVRLAVKVQLDLEKQSKLFIARTEGEVSSCG